MLTYLLCTTPRTGSTLLADWLESTGGMGAPREYFIPEFMDGMRKVLAFSSLSEYVTALGDLCSRAYGAYGIKFMWPTLADLWTQLAPDLRLEAFIRRLWPDAHFIHLTRADKVAQAISLYRAEQTNLWHRMRSGLEVRGDASRYGGGGGRFDAGRALACYRQIMEAERQWQRLFADMELAPIEVEYERLVAEPEATVREILRFVGAPVPAKLRLVSERLRQADDLSERWAEELRALLRRTEAPVSRTYV